tara:strand:+ start:421 stop:2403 length:1983 start_codon:yes stop_codon:yes gene_type:complete
MDSHVPAGYDSSGRPLTALECSTLLGISEFTKQNLPYFSKIKKGKILMITGLILFLIGLAYYPLLVVSLALLGIGYYVTKSAKSTPVVFPQLIVLEHSSTIYKGKPLIVSGSEESISTYEIDSIYVEYPKHNPSLGEDESLLYVEPGDNPKHSLNTINEFYSLLSSYHSKLSHVQKYNFSLNFISDTQASYLDKLNYSFDGPNWFLEEYIVSSELNDRDLSSENAAILDYFDNILESNVEVLTRFIKNYEDEYSGYENWCIELERIANQSSEGVLESMVLTYSHIDDASGEASALLLESVDHKIQENTRKIEFQAKQKMDELESKMSDMQDKIMERKDEIKSAISSQIQIVNNLDKEASIAQSDLNGTSSQISMELPYATVSGGGGSIGASGGSVSRVSSGVQYHTVHLPNPEYSSKQQAHRIISTLGRVEQERLKSLKNQLSSTENLVEQRREAILLEQENRKKEYQERMEEERKELSKHSLAVKALHEDILENPIQIDVDDLTRLVNRSWLQPAKIVDGHLNGFGLKYQECTEIFRWFKERYELISSNILAGSPTQLGSNGKMYSHWLLKGNEVIDLIKLNSEISLDNPMNFTTVPSKKSEILSNPYNNQNFPSMRRKPNSQSLGALIEYHALQGSIEAKLAKKLSGLCNKDVNHIMR